MADRGSGTPVLIRDGENHRKWFSSQALSRAVVTCTVMSNIAEPAGNLPLTPCTGICRLDDRGYCVGCRRTAEEIGRWRAMGDAERLHVMQVVLPGRKSS